MPAKTVLFDVKANPIHSFGILPRNFLAYQPQGRLFILAGFGNLSGTIDIHDLRTRKLVTSFQAPNSTSCSWSACGRYIMTATLSPRLRVDNGVKIWWCGGGLLHTQSIEELYQVRCRAPFWVGRLAHSIFWFRSRGGRSRSAALQPSPTRSQQRRLRHPPPLPPLRPPSRLRPSLPARTGRPALGARLRPTSSSARMRAERLLLHRAQAALKMAPSSRRASNATCLERACLGPMNPLPTARRQMARAKRGRRIRDRLRVPLLHLGLQRLHQRLSRPPSQPTTTRHSKRRFATSTKRWDACSEAPRRVRADCGPHCRAAQSNSGTQG